MMTDIMGVLLNGVAQLEYDRSQLLPEQQAEYLANMDEKMNHGIIVDGEQISDPDLNQRARFVAANLAHAIKSNDEHKAAAMCTYLAERLPELKQVKIEDSEEGILIDLVFDEQYQKQAVVEFPKLH